jgi:methylated-DNA-[protein]-cysteine S-methyltransferase
MSSTYKAYYDSPIGLIEVVGTDEVIKSLNFIEPGGQTETAPPSPVVADCLAQLDEYFKGQRREFSLPLDPDGTGFQKKVWQQLLTVGYGQTASYLEIARQLGNEKAIRAVGGANGQNPISIIIPCHRIIGSDGSLIGYGGGLWRKAWLLNHEGSLHTHKQMSLF